MRRTSNLSLLSLAALTSEPLSTPYPIGLDHCLPDPTTGASKVMEGALDFTSPSSLLLSTINRESRRAIAHHVARVRREDELPVHLASAQHQC